jgi:hypothetical protein
MALTGTQYKSLHAALLGAFNAGSLKRMLRFEMNEDLDHIAGGVNFSEIIDTLLDWAEENEKTRELVEAAHTFNPDNVALTSVWREITQGAVASTGRPKPGEPDEPRKIKILFLAANPEGTDRILLDEEIRAIKERIRASEYRDRLEIESEWAVRPLDLQRALLEHAPDIVHFSSHGTQNEELVLHDENGQSKPVSKEALQHLFSILNDNIKVVVLNACYSEPQAQAIIRTIPCAVGMSKAIGVKAANTFSEAFYLAVGAGAKVKRAFDLGVNALLLQGISEERTPQLKVKEGVDISQLTLIEHE